VGTKSSEAEMSVFHFQRDAISKLIEDSQLNRAKYITCVDQDGLIQVLPRPRESFFAKIPFKRVALVLGLFCVLKANLVLRFGPQNYEMALESLRAGSFIDRFSAFALQIDPITAFISAAF